MQLKELYDYKNQLMEDILTTPEIINLITDGGSEDARSLAYKQVFPYEYVPETVQEGKTLICFDVDIQKSLNKTFLVPTIYVWVFAHRSKLRLPGGGLRVDSLCSELAKKINGSRYYGLGELELESVRRFAPMTDYQGKCLTFSSIDFNRQFEHNKPTPTKRKKY